LFFLNEPTFLGRSDSVFFINEFWNIISMNCIRCMSVLNSYVYTWWQGTKLKACCIWVIAGDFDMYIVYKNYKLGVILLKYALVKNICLAEITGLEKIFQILYLKKKLMSWRMERIRLAGWQMCGWLEIMIGYRRLNFGCFENHRSNLHLLSILIFMAVPITWTKFIQTIWYWLIIAN
jgi:hypothetical protein